ncbi:MAG: M50 family metallopeptidase [Oscillospiraceae bacterium]|nr:M50 family metallopeptidase [Oscillospiraceae bacterium]
MKKKFSFSQLLFLFIGGMIGFIISKFMINNVEENSTFEKVLILVILLISIFLAYLIQIIVHESGHLIFGLLTGYKFSSFRIGSIMFVKKNSKIKCKRFSLAGTGGQCLMTPPDFNNGFFPCMLYNFGGSIANLFLSIIALILFLSFRNILYLSPFLLLLVLIGIAFALTNGIPRHAGYVNNDGYNALHLNKNDVVKRAFWIQLKVNGLITDEIRLKDMPSELFEIPEDEYLNNQLCSCIGVLACSRAIDQQNFQKAKEIGNKILIDVPELNSIHKNLLISEMIFCELVCENRKDEIERLYTDKFKKFIKVLKNNLSITRMRYAYEVLVNNDEIAAKKLLDTFSKIKKTYPHQCEIEGELELIDYVNHIYLTRNNRE